MQINKGSKDGVKASSDGEVKIEEIKVNKGEDKKSKVNLARISEASALKFDMHLTHSFHLKSPRDIYPCFPLSQIESNLNITHSFFGTNEYYNK